MLKVEEPAADEVEMKATEESPKAEEVATTLAPVADAEEAKSGNILKGIFFLEADSGKWQTQSFATKIMTH